MVKERIETYRISPTGNNAVKLRKEVDFFLQLAPGIDSENAEPALEDGLAGEAYAEMCKLSNINEDNIFICDRRRRKFSRDDFKDVDFSQRMIYCHKKEKESELSSLLRHMRNALAHGNLFVKFFRNNTLVCLQDFCRDGKPSALIVTNKATLEKWRNCLERKS